MENFKEWLIHNSIAVAPVFITIIVAIGVGVEMLDVTYQATVEYCNSVNKSMDDCNITMIDTLKVIQMPINTSVTNR